MRATTSSTVAWAPTSFSARVAATKFPVALATMCLSEGWGRTGSAARRGAVLGTETIGTSEARDATASREDQGNDKLYGGPGNDDGVSGAGRDVFSGGSGRNRVIHDGSGTPVTIDLTLGVVVSGSVTDLLFGVQDVLFFGSVMPP